MQILRSQKGEFSLQGLFFWFVVALIGYMGFQMAIPWVKYNQVNELFRNEVTRLKVEKEEEVRKAIDHKLKEMKIELYAGKENDYIPLKITYESGKPAVMEAILKIDVDLIAGYKYHYTFYPRQESKVPIEPRY